MKMLVMASVMLAGVFVFTSCNKEGGTGGTTITEGQWIDLGLPSGILWASYNVGATSPLANGDFFSWGETQPKEDYSAATYKYCRYVSSEERYFLTKYCNQSIEGYEGYTDNLTVLESSDDAATAQWGGEARTPTKEEWQELLDNTTEQLIEVNGVEGCLFTASNGRNVFLPLSGTYDQQYYSGEGFRGSYLSSSLNTGNPKCYYHLNCGGERAQVYPTGGRTKGVVVRPVRSAK